MNKLDEGKKEVDACENCKTKLCESGTTMNNIPGLIEVEPGGKLCAKCKQEKSLNEFHKYKAGFNKGLYHSYCYTCNSLYKKEFFKKYPWKRTYENIINRCNDKEREYYYKKGIKNFLTLGDLKKIWFRDKAFVMKKATIHRKDSKGHYTFSNCEFIEEEKHKRLERGPYER